MFYSGDVWAAYLRPFTGDLTPYVQRDAAEIGLEDYFPEIRAAMQHEGRYFVVPETVNVSLLYFNRGLFRAAGGEAVARARTGDPAPGDPLGGAAASG